MQAIELDPERRAPGSQAKLLPLPPHCERFTGVYWKPSFSFIAELATYLKGQKVLEIFAGNGYLAGLLASEGVDVLSTTIFSGHDMHEYGLYHAVEELSAVEAVLDYRDSRDILLICWATVTNAVLQSAMLWGPGRPIVFIGEMTDYSRGHYAGCATDEFFEHFEVTHRFQTYRGNALEHAVVGRMSATPVVSIGR